MHGGGVWTDASSRELKENFAAVKAREVLDRVAAMPISSWNYKAEDHRVRYLGTTAEDFHAAFGLGQDDRHLAALDSNGVFLAAIQGLYEIVKHKDAQIESLRAEKDAQITALEARLLALEEAIAAVPRKDAPRAGGR